MQRACARGLLFEEWFAEAAPIGLATMDKDLLKVEYIQFQDQATVLNRFKSVIVTDRNGWPPERLKFVIHHDEQFAQAHGLATLGKGNFVLKGWSQFKQSTIHHQMEKTIASYNRIFRFRKPNQTP